ncbi:MAG: DUF1844 domain-containing protein [Pirellulales bacterium]|nr:DUF1844 domain-containing protein [Pirellulales bacterium]
MNDPEKKIVVDEDWKSQVEAERDAQREEKAKQPDADSNAGRELPPPSFQLHISNLATQALMFLGQFPNPITEKQEIRLNDAKHVIDTLVVLDEKTKGNLDDQEAQMMEGVLHELRMAFVSVQQYVANGGAAQEAGKEPAADEKSGSSIEIPE